jgi:hypothetical protein
MARAGKEVDAVRAGASLEEFVKDPERPESAQRRAEKADAGAVRAPAGIDLDEIHACPGLSQLNGRGHAGKAAADYENCKPLSRHALLPIL